MCKKRQYWSLCVFYRTNIPLNDHAFAFENDARNQNSKNYGTGSNKYIDIRTCSTTSAGGGLPSQLDETNIYGDEGIAYAGNTTHGYKHVNVAFFESSGNGYLILDLASSTNNDSI